MEVYYIFRDLGVLACPEGVSGFYIPSVLFTSQMFIWPVPTSITGSFNPGEARVCSQDSITHISFIPLFFSHHYTLLFSSRTEIFFYLSTVSHTTHPAGTWTPDLSSQTGQINKLISTFKEINLNFIGHTHDHTQYNMQENASDHWVIKIKSPKWDLK